MEGERETLMVREEEVVRVEERLKKRVEKRRQGLQRKKRRRSMRTRRRNEAKAKTMSMVVAVNSTIGVDISIAIGEGPATDSRVVRPYDWFSVCICMYGLMDKDGNGWKWFLRCSYSRSSDNLAPLNSSPSFFLIFSIIIRIRIPL